MRYTRYPKGSIWRKWDLHVHTPFTKLNNQYPTDDTVWDSFCDKIENSDVEVYGITDYFSVENYFTFIEKYRVKYPDSKKMFFPNVELRLEVSVNRNAEEVNLHILFNNETEKEKIVLFLSKLNTNISRNGAPVSCSAISSHTDFKSAGIDYKILRKKLTEVFGKDECYLIVAASNNAGLRPDSKSPRKLNITDEIDKICDGFFGGQQNVDYFLSTQRYEEKETAKQKPVISCSDAHSFDELENYLGKRFVKVINGKEIIEKDITWIKANPTFEGLKQITYEPDGRIKIQQEKPEEKTPYNVIDAVRFIDTRATRDFNDNWIELNSNLNSIIGGKSSGKSLLLYHIAKTIDADRINSINAEKGYHQEIEYSFEKEPEFNFEVKWADGETYKLKDSEKPNRPITYIPQLYLNRLAEDQKDELNSLVDKMLIESSSEYKEFRNSNKQKLDDIRTEMFQVIDEYYKVKNSLNGKERELKELGDKKAIIENQKQIIEKIEALRKESSFSKEDEEKFKILSEKIKTLKEQQSETKTLINVLSNAKESYESFKDNIQNILGDTVFSSINSQFAVLSPEISQKISDIVSQSVKKLKKVLDDDIGHSFSSFNEEQRLDAIKKNLESTTKELEPLAEKVKSKSAFSQLQKSLETESAKLRLLNGKEIEIGKLNELLSTEATKNKYGKLFKCYQDVVEENRKYESIPDTDDLKLNSIIKINKKKFDENFVRKINKKKSMNQQFGAFFNSENDYEYEQEKHLSNINIMIDKIASCEISLNSGFDEKHTMLSLLDDYYYIDYDLLQDGDDLIKMSPGKRGIILFQLFLHLSKSENPILIDQPEDNLDNRTVYQELNDFIKTKKSTRQIIIVSHNPNLVVSTDSENIIVANQDGQNKSGKNATFKFEYVNGAIEHSFIDESKNGILFQRGIRQHVCDVLEGGEEAFEKRENKYGFK